MNLNTRIKNNKIGPAITGKIVGLFVPNYVNGNPFLKERDFAFWERYYPNCKANKVALVRLDCPERTITLEEALRMGINRHAYELLPKNDFMFFPMEDLVRIA